MNIKMRQAQYCNLKLMLIFLVIYGHVIEDKIVESWFLMMQYKLIYMVHMPLFVFLSGFFLKTEKGSLKQAIWAFKTYFICQCIAMIIGYLKGETKTLWTPYWHLWYLLSLGYWCLICYGWYWLVRHVPKVNGTIVKAMILIFTIVAACLVGGNGEIGRFLSLSRSIVFLPYLLAGMFCPKDICWKKYRVVTIALLFLCIILIRKRVGEISYFFLYHASAYGKLGLKNGVVRRLLCYLFGAGLGGSFLTLFSGSRRTSWSKMGVDTKWMYLFHAPIVIILETLEIPLKLFLFIAPIIAIYIIIVLYKVFQWNIPICGIDIGKYRSKKYILRKKRGNVYDGLG